MKQLYLHDSESHITKAAIRSGRQKLLPARSVLFVVRSGILNRTFPVAINEVRSAINQDLKALHPYDGIEPSFIAYFVQSAQWQLLEECSKDGTTVASIDLAALRDVDFALPSLVEQRAIVHKIERLFSELDKGVEQLQTVQAQLKRYRQAVLKAAFEGRLTADWRTQQESLPTADELLEQIRAEREAHYQQQLEQWEQAVADWEAAGGKESGQKKPRKPGKPKDLRPLTDDDLAELPEGWRWCRLNAMSEISGGLTKNAKREHLPLRLPYLRVGNVYSGRLELSDVREIGVTEDERDKTLLKEGDLLFVEGNGSPGQIGRVAVWDGSICPCLHQNHLIRCRPIVLDTAKFLLYWFLSPAGRSLVMREASSTSGLHTLSINKVCGLVLPAAPLREQRQIVNEIESRLSVLDELERAVETGLKQAEALRQSILKHAFEGQLLSEAELAAVRADPEYEPAGRLLERIRTEREPVAAVPEPTRRIRLPKGERYRQAAFAAYAVNRLADRPTFGRTQMMKYLYVVPHLLAVESHIHPRREAAGPWDPAIYKIEALGRNKGWFGVRKSGQRYTYRRGTSIDDGYKAAVENMGPGRVRVDWLLDEFARWDTQQAELLATTLAVWNDHLIEGRRPTQKQIVEGVHRWHPDKAEKFPAKRIRDCIKWMKDHDLVPQGIGPKSEPVGSVA